MIATTNSTVTSSKKDAHCLGCFGVFLGFAFVVGLVGVMIYNLIKSIIAIISFTHNDVEKICPNSDLWWFALFVGVIWPILGSNGARNAANSKSDTEDPIIVGSCTVFTYITLLTTFSLWAWDQLWGIKGFANDQCAMNHWANKNTTDGANNDGHDLFTVVEWWMYIYMTIDAVLILCVLGLCSIVVIENCQNKSSESTTSTIPTTTTTKYSATGKRSSKKDAAVQDNNRLQEVLTGDYKINDTNSPTITKNSGEAV